VVDGMLAIKLTDTGDINEQKKCVFSSGIIDTILIPNRIINNGRNVKVPTVVFVCRRRFGGVQFFISVHTNFEKYGIIFYNDAM
jgi:hypothetical protein